MPRHESGLNVCEKDIDSLTTLASQLDNEISLRAKIILAFIDETHSPNVANALGVSIDTVRKWKQAYMENGISGLYPSVKQRSSTIELKNRIQNLMKEYDSEVPLTVPAIAKILEVSDNQVYYALRSMGTSLIRKNQVGSLHQGYLAWNWSILMWAICKKRRLDFGMDWFWG